MRKLIMLGTLLLVGCVSKDVQAKQKVEIPQYKILRQQNGMWYEEKGRLIGLYKTETGYKGE